MNDDLPVVVVGAGPSGLAAAAHLLDRGLEPLVVEAGAVGGDVGARVASRAAVLPVGELVDSAAEKLLAPTGWVAPDPDRYPTGREWAEEYLQPLAEALGDRVRYGSRVVGVARRGWDLVVDSGRETEPLTVHVVPTAGEERITARAVVDASGTWARPNPLGADGWPALGEPPRPTGSATACRPHRPGRAARYAGKRVAVAGSGHSALTALVAFADLADQHPGTHVEWLLRRGSVGDTFGGGEPDQLPARGALGQRAARRSRRGTSAR